jgi:hypothetical protein
MKIQEAQIGKWLRQENPKLQNLRLFLFNYI